MLLVSVSAWMSHGMEEEEAPARTLLSTRLLTVNAGLNKSTKIMFYHIYSVLDNC